MPLAAPALPREPHPGVERFWFVGIDIARLRPVLFGRARLGAAQHFSAAASSIGARVIACSAIAYGVRAIVAAPSHIGARLLIRRFCARSAKLLPASARWRTKGLVAHLQTREIETYAAFIQRCELAFPEERPMTRTAKKNGAAPARRAATFLRDIERSVDGLLGADEAGRRYRRYVAEHDAPADDSAAYARLCVVIFAQGLGFAAVEAKLAEFITAFDGFVPERVAEFDDERIGRIMQAPIIRNEAKVRACVENAKRWVAAAGSATYLAKVAQIAVDDDAAGGWPALTKELQKDFARIGDTAARQTLKRWGFFTAFAHPGSRRVLERLGLVEAADAPAAVQCFVGSVARVIGRDPYQLEATLALFASLGPCKRQPECEECPLAERCPTATARVL